MGITNANKEIDVSKIGLRWNRESNSGALCSTGYFFQSHRHCSGAGPFREHDGKSPCQYERRSKDFIDIIDESTDSSQDGNIGSGSHIGIVSFASVAVADTGLITSTEDLKNAVDGLIAGGATNHADAFSKAIQLFDPASSNARVIIMFTDGKTTAGAPPAPVAAEARDAGIVIYCIGLLGDDGIDVEVLNDWALTRMHLMWR